MATIFSRHFLPLCLEFLVQLIQGHRKFSGQTRVHKKISLYRAPLGRPFPEGRTKAHRPPRLNFTPSYPSVWGSHANQLRTVHTNFALQRNSSPTSMRPRDLPDNTVTISRATKRILPCYIDSISTSIHFFALYLNLYSSFYAFKLTTVRLSPLPKFIASNLLLRLSLSPLYI